MGMEWEWNRERHNGMEWNGNGIASGSVAEWNRERQRRGNGGIISPNI